GRAAAPPVDPGVVPGGSTGRRPARLSAFTRPTDGRTGARPGIDATHPGAGRAGARPPPGLAAGSGCPPADASSTGARPDGQGQPEADHPPPAGRLERPAAQSA